MWRLGAQAGLYAALSLSHHFGEPQPADEAGEAAAAPAVGCGDADDSGGDIFKLVCPDAVALVAPLADCLLAPAGIVPLSAGPPAAGAAVEATLENGVAAAAAAAAVQMEAGKGVAEVHEQEQEQEEEEPDHLLFAGLRQDFVRDAIDEYRSATADGGDVSVSPERIATAALNLALRQLFVLAFDTAVDRAPDYYPVNASLADATRALVNLALIRGLQKS